MIREFEARDLNEINNLLKSFNYNIDMSSKNQFLKVLVYVDKKINGILVYELIYDRIEIDYIIVSERERRKGIATKLIKYLVLNNEVDNITLEVRSSNHIAIKLYEKQGFKIIATRKNYYKNENGFLMIKKLGDSDE